MSKKLAVVMDPIADIKPYKDTTLALLLAATKAGWDLAYLEIGDLSLDQGVARGFSRTLEVFDDNEDWYRLGDGAWSELGDFDMIFMRQDPPFDSQFLYATYILEAAEKAGARVVNRAASLRDCNEKVFATQFPQCCPPVLVATEFSRFHEFHAEHGDIILKPLDGMGGMSIFRVKKDDPNLNVILETLTNNGERAIMAQRYLPEIAAGDKRILLIGGEPVPFALARIPMAGETRGNLAAGGRGVAQPLTDRDRWICERVGPALVERGLYFVGIDVIGDYLTEINVTSPTCVRELDEQCQLDIGSELISLLEKELAGR